MHVTAFETIWQKPPLRQLDEVHWVVTTVENWQFDPLLKFLKFLIIKKFLNF